MGEKKVILEAIALKQQVEASQVVAGEVEEAVGMEEEDVTAVESLDISQEAAPKSDECLKLNVSIIRMSYVFVTLACYIMLINILCVERFTRQKNKFFTT